MSEGIEDGSGLADSVWLPRPPLPGARVRLFCFPCSGGDASQYREWASGFPGWVDVLPVRLPGRAERADEALPGSMSELGRAVAEGIGPHLRAPFAFFGHSMGGLVAYELALRLRSQGGPMPVALFVAGTVPPHLPGAMPPPGRTDDELLDAAFALGGIPRELRADDEFTATLLPPLRADTSLLAAYEHRSTDPLSCRLSAFCGTRDPIARPDDVRRWPELADGPASVHELPGGHFFVHGARDRLWALITDELRRLVPEEKPTGAPAAAVDPVAIVGIGCRFPGAGGPEEFWRLLSEGVDAVTGIPAERFDAREYPAVPPWGGFVDGVEEFDAAFFGISPREAERMDPRHRLLLEVAWEALEDAGVPPGAGRPGRAGVFVGHAGPDDYWELQTRRRSPDLHTMTGSGLSAFLAGRLSYALDLRGPSLAVDSACSASLTALHLACQSLRTGECDLALASGVNLVLLPEPALAYAQARMLAERGRCRFGDAEAEGFVRSDGVGVVVLKPLGRALADRDRVYAVIAGSAVNNDGQAGGFLVTPAQEGQEQMLSDALHRAAMKPADVDYVEAHGTGTTVGDAVELRALASVLEEGRAADRPCWVGSVKTNIGHPEAAAGIAGLIKTALMLHHQRIVASLHLRTPNPALDWDGLPLRIPTTAQPWPGGARRAVAGVSSFGLSGTNAHAVLVPAAPLPARPSPPGDVPLILPLSARSPVALTELAARYADRLERADRTEAAAVCAAAARRRVHHPYRLTVRGDDGTDLARALRDGDLPTEPVREALRVAFVFPGQGSQWIGMGRELSRVSPVFRTALEECGAVIEAETGWSLAGLLHDDDPHRWQGSAVIQPAIWAMQVALARQWQAWGVRPDVLIGHSMGEVAAAHLDGALSLADAARVICRRSALAGRTDGDGAMTVVGLPAPDAEAEVAPYGGRISVAAHNSPRSTVLSGDRDALLQLLATLEERGVPCRRVQVDFASHSAHMDPLREPLIKALGTLAPRPAGPAFRSTVPGTAAPGRILDAGYWADNMRRPVLFAETVTAVADEQPTVFVEVSPHPVLLVPLRDCLGEDRAPDRVLPTLHRDHPGLTAFADTLARLHTMGADIHWDTLYPGPCPATDLPRYPWQHQHFPLPATSSSNREALPQPPSQPVLGNLVRPPEAGLRLGIRQDNEGWHLTVSGTTATSLWIGTAHEPQSQPPSGQARPHPGPIHPGQKSPGITDRAQAPSIRQEILGELSEVLGLAADRIPRRQPLRDLGLDSLMAAEVRARLMRRWPVDIPLALLLGNAAVDALVDAVTTALPPGHPATAP